jgi:hypothetical protein
MASKDKGKKPAFPPERSPAAADKAKGKLKGKAKGKGGFPAFLAKKG